MPNKPRIATKLELLSTAVLSFACLPSRTQERPLSVITEARAKNNLYCPSSTQSVSSVLVREVTEATRLCYSYLLAQATGCREVLSSRVSCCRGTREMALFSLTALPEMRFLQAGCGRNDWSVVLGRLVQLKLLLQLKAKLLISKELGWNAQIGCTCRYIFFRDRSPFQEFIPPISIQLICPE